MTQSQQTKPVSDTSELFKAPPQPPLAPHLVVNGAGTAIDFYARAFGAQVMLRNDTPDGKVLHATLSLPNGGVFMLCDDFSEMGTWKTPQALGGSPVTLHLDLSDVDATWQTAIAAGASEIMALADQFWGDRYGVLQDPFGHRWSLATRKRQVSAQELEEETKRLSFKS